MIGIQTWFEFSINYFEDFWVEWKKGVSYFFQGFKYESKINKNTLWSLNFSKIWVEVPHTSLTGCFGSVNQLILLKIKHI
jgi:hypothetical protein